MTGASIWEHVAAHVPAQGPGLVDAGWALPDDGDSDAPPSPPGARDGVRLLHGGVEVDDAAGNEVGDLVLAALGGHRQKPYTALYERVRGSDVLTYLEPLLERVADGRPNPDHLYDLGRVLVTTGRHRDPVKLGLALFGFFESGRHIDAVLTLGRHDEFTYYGVLALVRGLDDPEPLLWQLAQNAAGWGRIHAVRALLRIGRRPEVRGWLLRQGFRNERGDEYLACDVARAADLAGALGEEEPDEELLDAGASILRTLLVAAPGQGIDDYADGAVVAAALAAHLEARASTLSHLLALHDVDAFVQAPGEWTGREARGWTPGVRESVHRAAQRVAAWPEWSAVVGAALDSPDPAEFTRGIEAARLVGVDAVPALLRRLREDPLQSAAWSELMAQAGDDRIEEAVRLAMACLPLTTIASGPGRALATDPEYRAHACLDAVLSGLGGWPGRGWALVRAALASPAVRNRNLALRVLDQWGRSSWPRDAEAELRRAADRDPEAEVRRRIERLLAGRPLEAASAPPAGR